MAIENTPTKRRTFKRKYIPIIDPNYKDPVNQPAHYTDGNIEVIDFIEDKKLNYHRGNCVKYVARAGKKDPAKELEDLKKARWYLDREISNLEKLP